jgi:parallel beta-helix repeat protein
VTLCGLSAASSCSGLAPFPYCISTPAPPPTPSGGKLTPIPKPAGAYVLPSSVCGAPDGSAALQAALNAAAGGSLWIPDGCIVNTSVESGISSNTTIACGVGAGIHNMAPIACYGAPSSLVSHSSSNVTIEGCTFTGIYTPSMAAQGDVCGAGGPNGGGAPAQFYGGSNIVFTDNAVTNDFSGQGLFFGGDSNVTISNNYFANNFLMGMQLSNCQNCNVTGNYSLDSNWDMEDETVSSVGSTSGTWSNNTFACDSTGTGWGSQFYPGAYFICEWNAGEGCSAYPSPCTPGEYSAVTYQNNTITGPGADLDWSSYDSATLINNTYTNGGVLSKH